MRATEQLGRYRLLDLVTQDAGAGDREDVYLWHAYDEILDRPVAIRVMSADDPRSPAVLGAAQAAARVDDRRLLRVLDILTLPQTDEDAARVAVVTEWASGRNLERTLQDRGGTPFAPAEAMSLVTEVARALAAAATENVSHGRLRPSSVFITDAGEIRIRGLAVDAALFGELPEAPRRDATDRAQGDVDALGCLLYLLATGYWPGARSIAAPEAPRANGVVLPPSQIRASVPRTIDDVVARSVTSASRQRGVPRVVDAAAFATMAGASLDHLAPVAGVRSIPPSAAQRTRRVVLVGVARLVGVAAALGVVAGLAWLGWQMVTSNPPDDSAVSASASAAAEQVLTSPARPVDDVGVPGVQRVFPITSYRSYDPYGDDDGNGKPDGRKGRENDEMAATVNDTDPATAWLTSQYPTPNFDGKPGVGLVLDLGESRDVQQVSLNLVGKGSDVDIRVADRIFGDLALWTPLATVNGAQDSIDVRAPRPVTGRYVLIWFTSVPPAENAAPGTYQGGVRSVVVSG